MNFSCSRPFSKIRGVVALKMLLIIMTVWDADLYKATKVLGMYITISIVKLGLFLEEGEC